MREKPRINLDNTERSKQVLRIFLENEILAQTSREFLGDDEHQNVLTSMSHKKFQILPLENIEFSKFKKQKKSVDYENFSDLEKKSKEIVGHDNFCRFGGEKLEQDFLTWHESSSICNSVSIDGSLASCRSYDRIPILNKNNDKKINSWWRRKFFCCLGS